MAKSNQHVGSSFDDFLQDEGLLEEASSVAVKRVIAWQLAEAMRARGITKKEMAARMETSRSSLDRLLDEQDTSLTLDTLTRAAQALGCRIKVELVA